MRPPLLLPLAAGLLIAVTAHAGLIVNPGFDSGTAGWGVANAGSGDFYHYSGSLSPVSSAVIPAPQGGGSALVTDQTGPGSHVLYQDFLVPLNLVGATLTFDYFVNNAAGVFVNNGTLVHNGTPNQHARVDLMSAASLFGTGGTDVWQNVLLIGPGSPTNTGWLNFALDVTAVLQAHAGDLMRLRFGEVDNQGNFRFGVDNVQITTVTPPAAVPDLPATLGLLGVGLAGMLAAQNRRQSQTA